MTNDKTVTMPLELAEAILSELTSGAVSVGTGAKLRALLAAPVVERQEPVVWIDPYAVKDLAARPNTARGVVKAKADRINGYTQPLYASPPAPVAVLPDRKLRVTIEEEPDDQMRMLSQIERNGWNACLDKVKELNQ